MIGETISHYRILSRLGAGGMGEVYKAEDLRLHRQVAVKVLRAGSPQSEEARTRFLREAQAAAALNHPNIATIYEIDQFERAGHRSHFIVMEYVPGRALNDYARAHNPSVAEAVELVLQIADALSAAHQRRIVHRDVKPSNVIVTDERRIKVLDFGLAKFLPQAESDTASELRTEILQTTPGVVMGTYAYMSPEQARGQAVDHRSDIFSLGVLFYELLAGRLPFAGDTTVAVVESLLHAEPPALSQYNHQVSAGLERVVRRMLEKDRARRYPDLREVSRDLEASKKARRCYEFGPFRLDVAERQLLREGKVIELKPKVFDLLVVLVENAGRLLEKEELLNRLWPDSFVEEVNLSVNVSALRRALGENASVPEYIETVPKKGYRFIASVTEKVLTDRGAPATELLPVVIDRQGETAAGEAQATPVTEIIKDETGSPTSVPARRFALLPAPWLLAAAVLLAAALGSFWWWFAKGAKPQADTARMRTIAVLPFKSLKAGEADQAFELGMADALITRLGSLHTLTVRPTSAILKYSDANIDPVAAGRELGVDAVLDGRLQRDEKMIRVTAQLLKVSDGSPLWTGKFDDFFTNVFALQDSISEKMTEALSMQLTKDEQQRMTKRYTENTEAYQLYLQGRYFLFKYQFAKAQDFFQAAVAKDPDYPLAYAGLATNYVALAVTTPDRQEMRDKALAAANKAVSLDPNLDEAHSALGWIKFLGDWDWPGAEQELRRAIELNPNNADARQNYASLLNVLGRHDEALGEIEQARQLDPVSSVIRDSYALILFHARRYDQALEQCRKALELDPQHRGAYFLLPRIYAAQSMFEQVIAEYEKHQGEEAKAWTLFAAYAHARLGHRAEAEKMIQILLPKASRTGASHMIALIYAGLGDKERALEWLEKAYQARDNQMIHLKVDPEWDTLRSEARFNDLLRRMRLAP
jgi:serine/threonine protein kinase/TolB-like protein